MEAKSNSSSEQLEVALARITELEERVADLTDTIQACLIACGGSEDIEHMEKQYIAAGSKPSDFIAQIGGRLLNLISDWESSGRSGYCLPVIRSELIHDIDRILRGETNESLERAEMQHDIRMTEDKYYRMAHEELEKKRLLDTYGINE